MAEADVAQELNPPRTKLWVHAALLILTIGTTTMQGYRMTGPNEANRLLAGLAFAGTLLAILLSHEMGHYVFARIHRIDTSLPYVIPAPPGFGFGTFGAIIRMRSPIATRDALIDVGASGPIAGAIVALPLLVVGLRLSAVGPSPTGQASFWFGHETLWSMLLSAWHHFQQGAPVPSAKLPVVGSFGDNLLMRGMTWLVFGKIPPGSDVFVHPVAIAAWFGLLVTCLNLFPIGQLDGGHVSYAVLGPRGHRWLSEAVSAGLLVLAFVSSLSWTLWWIVTRFALGFGHPAVEQAGVKIGPLRGLIAFVALALFIATFVPVPLDQM
jgi:membrane-associated protease RseP (regulator of RpoE activity)